MLLKTDGNSISFLRRSRDFRLLVAGITVGLILSLFFTLPVFAAGSSISIGPNSISGSGATTQLYRENGDFRVNGGVLNPLADEQDAAVLESSEAPSLFARVSWMLLNIIVSQAHAADVVTNPGDIWIYDASPMIIWGPSGGATIDWQTQGLNGSYSIFDGTNSTVPFYLESGGDSYAFRAYSNGDVELADGQIYIDKTTSHVGIGTTTPSVKLHLAGQNPKIYLKDKSENIRWSLNNNPSGLVFDIAGKDTISTIETTPFSMDYGAPDNSLVIKNSGNIGIGKSNPSVPLHVGSPDNKSAGLLVENTVAPTAPGDVSMFELRNTGSKILRFTMNAGGPQSIWTFDNDPNYNSGAGINSGRFRIAKSGTGVVEFSVDGYGNVTANGLYFSSSRELKKDFQALDERDVLAKLVSLPVTEWRYKKDGSRHFGPVAEEFQQIFGLGDGKHISTVDTAGVTMAAVKGLYKVVQDKDAELSKLKKENSSLAERLKVLEDLVLTREVASLSSY